MATATLSSNKSSASEKDKHLELFSLIWLDSNDHVKENRGTQQKLRAIINHFKKFYDISACQEYIEQRSEDDRIVLIVSGRLGQTIVPSVHELQQVFSIYVYCMNRKANELWACKFQKIKGVVTELDDLISQIHADSKIQKNVEEPLSINMFTTNNNAGESTVGVNGQFVFSQVLTDCLLRMKSDKKDTNELISCCRSEYEGNEFELDNLREFQQKYSPSTAIWWYTRDSFFYKTLNAALRTKRIHMTFLFRSFIADIHRQLQHHQVKRPLKVFRSQLISKVELNALKKCLGQLISINSFFSTSSDYTTALSFLDSTKSRHLERVMFEIDADPRMVTTKPFADIHSLSDFADEDEVLFMFGSIFRINSIDRDNEHIWIIRMTLCSDDEHDLKQVLTYMKSQNGIGATNLRILGRILWKMGQFDLAEKYYIRFLNELPHNDSSMKNLYEDLAEIASQKGDFDKSVQWQQKALELKEGPSPSNIKSNQQTKFIVFGINILLNDDESSTSLQ